MHTDVGAFAGEGSKNAAAPPRRPCSRSERTLSPLYEFPDQHWRHLRTTNPIELAFASVRLRTNVAKRVRNREDALYLV